MQAIKIFRQLLITGSTIGASVNLRNTKQVMFTKAIHGEYFSLAFADQVTFASISNCSRSREPCMKSITMN